jgi:phage gp29-like protein
MVIDFAKETLTNCINRDVIYNLVRYNWGDAIAQRLSPSVSFTEGAAHDFAADAAAVAALQTSGYLHISQYQGIDSRLQLPERDLEAQMQDMEAEKQAQADQQQQTLDIARAKVQQPNPAENKGNNQNQDKGKQA